MALLFPYSKAPISKAPKALRATPDAAAFMGMA
jgi:hypothetical protein